MNFLSKFRLLTVLILLSMLSTTAVYSQVTSGSLAGVISDQNKEPLIGATVIALHIPTGTRYGTSTDESGAYFFPTVRIGGPYTITASYVGYDDQSVVDNYVSLGSTTNVTFKLAENSVSLQEIVVSSAKNDLISSKKTGAGLTLGRESLERMPTIGRTINDITKMNPYSNGRSFGGQDARFNNFTIDGAAFNNGFGLGSQAQAGGRTGSSAISLDALEEVQINIAPFDVRQSGFAGAGINAVTRSGTNDFNGSVFYFQKNQDYIGDKVNDVTISKANFDEKTFGARFGGPILTNKLFFFVNFEKTTSASPATNWIANRTGAVGQVSRVLASDLDKLSDFMRTTFDYETGPYENFNNELSSTKGLIRLDYNLSDRHKISLRYAQHDSESDAIISNSTSAGNGNRTNSATAISFQNSGYIIQDNTRSVVAELNSSFSNKLSNSFLVTFNKQIEDRKYRTALFPTIDILFPGATTTYTSVGFDPFTPSNKLNYNTLNVTNNLSYFLGKHNIVAGAAFEHFKSNNLFYPASNGAYVFNSLDDFYTAANAFKANPTAATSPVALRMQYRYSALPGGAEPLQILKVNKISAYVQDAFRVSRPFKLTYGLRADLISFGNTALENRIISAQTFKDPNGNPVKVNTGNLPQARVQLSPRIGFNWDVKDKQNTQVRGGTGLFLSGMPYVWISNQVGNNGVLTGFLDNRNTKNYPFTTDPSRFRPSGELDLTKLTFDINATQKSLKFPQVWKTNLAVDQRLFKTLVGTLELIYNKNINAVQHIDINLEPTTNKFAGVDQRLRYAGSGAARAGLADTLRRVNDNVINNILFQNTDEGYAYSITAKVEKPLSAKWGAMLAYTYGIAKDLASAGSTASESYRGITSVNGSNRPDLAYTGNDLRHRAVGFVNYVINYGGKFGGSTMFTLSGVGSSGYKVSFVYGGDMNGDGVNNNDLIFVPKTASDLRFTAITGSAPFTTDQQIAAFDKYIAQDEYLNSRKGTYVERNGGVSPWLTRFDFSAEQEFFVRLGGSKKSIKIRADLFNAGNAIDNTWGVGNATTASAQPLTFVRVDADGVPVYRLNTQVIAGKTELLRDSFIKATNTDNAWQLQLGARITF